MDMITLYGPDNRPLTRPDTRHYGNASSYSPWGYGLLSSAYADKDYQQHGLRWYQKVANEAQVDASLDILYSAVASCWKSASGMIPSQDEWEGLKATIAHLPEWYQAQILLSAFDISAPQVIPPKNPTDIELLATDFAREVIDDMLGRNYLDDVDTNGRNFGTVISQTLFAVEDMKSVQEIDWFRVSGSEWDKKWAIGDMLSRYPEYFDYNSGGKLVLRPSLMTSSTVPLPPNKFVVWLHHDRYEEHTGKSRLKSLGMKTKFKWNGEAMENMALERHGMPTPIGYLDEDSDTDSTTMIGWLEKLQRGAPLVLTKEDTRLFEDVKLLESRTTGQGPYHIPITRNDKYVSKVLLGSGLALEEGQNSGSFALASATAAPNFRRKVQMLLNEINWIHSTTTLSWLTWFNFPKGTRPPRLNIQLPTSMDILDRLSTTPEQAV